ncbi:hypothetical protein WME88_44040 [Sorangium sp. So ce216]
MKNSESFGRVSWWSDKDCRGKPPAYCVFRAGGTIPPFSTGTIPVAAAGPDAAARSLASMEEDDVVSALLRTQGALFWLSNALLGEQTDYWLAVGLRPCDLVHHPWQGKPGDLDILIGPVSSGNPDFFNVVGIEVKVLRVRANQAAKGSSYGTTQAKGLLKRGVQARDAPPNRCRSSGARCGRADE